MDGSWTLPLMSTISITIDNAARDEFKMVFPEHRQLSVNNFTIDQVRGLTIELKGKHSYCPATWTSRAYNLLRLGFPDLAIGDAYRAILLFEQYEDPAGRFKAVVKKEIWRQARGSLPMKVNVSTVPIDKSIRIREYAARARDRTSLILAQALFLANCYTECYEFLKDYSPKHCPADKRFDELKTLAERAQMIEDMSRFEDEDYVDQTDKQGQEARRSGHIQAQVYPWSEPFVQREEHVLTKAKIDMLEASNNDCTLSQSLTINPISSTGLGQGIIQVMGVRASRDFRADELLLVDRTFLSGVDQDHRNRCSGCRGPLPVTLTVENEARCCDVQFCSTACKMLSQHYHFRLCRRPQNAIEIKDLLLNSSSTPPDTIASNDLLYRVLAYLEHNPTYHPLRTPALGAMTPAYGGDRETQFSWMNDIKRPIIMLTTLDINIFKDHAFDTWVIQTIQARIRNNIRDFTDDKNHYHLSINLLYMFFNHSCDPNVQADLDDFEGNHLSITASRFIEHSEELFLSYIDPEDLERPYAERQELLKNWTGGKCQCQRCQQELAELENAERTRYPSPIFQLPEGDPNDSDYEDELRFRGELNRYATEAMLIEKHPTMRRLGRKRPLHETGLAPLNYDNISDYDDSPSKRRPK